MMKDKLFYLSHKKVSNNAGFRAYGSVATAACGG
jgi:hypothetical protein